MSDATKVGIFALVVAGICAYFVMRIENLELRGSRREYHVRLHDAEGLATKSAVTLKGLRVGHVANLKLEGEFVNARLSLDRNVHLREGTQARVVSVGLLGEKELDLRPGPPGGRELGPKEFIVAKPSASLDKVIAQVGQVSENVEGITSNVRESLEDQRLRQLLESITELSKETRSLIAANKEDAHSAVVSVREMAQAITLVARQLSTPPPGVESGVGGSGTGSTTENLHVAAANLHDVTEKLNRGEGTLGKLLASEETGEKLDRTLDSVGRGADAIAKSFGGFGGIHFSIQLRSDYLFQYQKPKGFGLIDVRTSGPWFMRVGFATQPTGLRTERLFQTTTLDSAGTVGNLARFVAEREDGIGFSLMGGGRWGPLVARGGLLESRWGVGADLIFLRDRLRLTLDAWDFGHQTWQPHLRLEGSVSPFPWGALIAGWDDPLNRALRLDSFFLGVGLKFPTEEP